MCLESPAHLRAERYGLIRGALALPGLLELVPVRCARFSGRFLTLLQMETDTRLASVHGSPNPTAPIESRAWAC